MVARTLLFLALAGLLSSAIYLLLALIAAIRFRFALPETASSGEGEALLPPVTVLKPLHGMEPLLEQSLESFFRQDYPTFELIFGARNGSDPALEVVEALRQKHPDIKTRIILSGEPAYPNAKVYTLVKMLAAASYPYVVISDSDVRVASDFLKQVVCPLLDANVGLVTCIYRGVPTGGLWSRLEALGMSVEMSSGVLVAELLEGMKFALGPAMATRKDILAELGGMEVLGAYCSDDFVLGQLTHAAGKRVVLSHHVIDHVALHQSARASLLHQVRWMKSTRFSRPLGHVGTVMTFAMPFGLLGLAAGLAAGSASLGCGLLSLAILNRVVQSIAVGWGVVRDPRSLRFCWLYPARDLLGFLLWCASFCGTEIVWRGERYRLEAGGKMARKSGPISSPPTSKDAAAQGASSRSVTVDHLP
jgi:ceramide glucosyltransferase